MKIVIAVDANPIISALIGGFAREVLFFHNFEFITTEYTLLEVKKYIPYICKKTGVSEDLLKILLQRVLVKIYSFEKYSSFISQAELLISDPKDVDILALAENCPLWSNDQHFKNVKAVRIITTKDFI